jgi:phosphatidate cytidylyltransferase
MEYIMLLKRLLTTAILGPLVIMVVLVSNQSQFAGTLIVALIVASWEFCSLIKIKSIAGKATFIMLAIAITYFLKNEPSLLRPVLIASSLWWIIALYWILTFPKHSRYLDDAISIKLVNGLFFLLPMILALIALHKNNSSLVLLLLALIWASDIGAYLAGTAFGKNKLCPKVSPGKTIEGALGGIILSLVVGALYVLIATEKPTIENYLNFGVLSLIISLVSILGDLFESTLKRIANIKDSGKILPGHGGLLDRIDSLTCGAPIFFLLFSFLI